MQDQERRRLVYIEPATEIGVHLLAGNGGDHLDVRRVGLRLHVGRLIQVDPLGRETGNRHVLRKPFDAEQGDLVSGRSVRAPAISPLARSHLGEGRVCARSVEQTEEDADRTDRGRDAGGEPHSRHREIEDGLARVVGRQELERRRILVLRKRVVERVAVGDQTGIVEVVEDGLNIGDRAVGGRRVPRGRIRDAEHLVRLIGRNRE